MRRFYSVGVVALAAGAALARPEIPYASLSAGATTINFDSLAGSATLGAGEVLGNQYAAQGVTFSVPNYNAYASTSIAAISTLQSDPNVIWINQGGGGAPNGLGINVDFSVPVHRAGAWVGGSIPGTFTIRAYNGATLLEGVTHALAPAPLGQEGFLAIERAEVITRIVFYSTNAGGTNWNFSIDDLKFEPVPAPGAGAAIGVWAVWSLRRRRLG